ncbi:hypothetical protein [Guyparkeria halopsychrophila]|uniref:hypothetical protein n=1 Tax=Guyparkeria halopsychrophila TaxID=3139421 RepID=UPI0037C58D81
MSAELSWKSLFDHEKADADFLLDRPLIIGERFLMDGKIHFDGENHFVEIPQELLDRAEMSVGDEIEVSGERLSSGYVITIERAFSDKEA